MHACTLQALANPAAVLACCKSDAACPAVMLAIFTHPIYPLRQNAITPWFFIPFLRRVLMASCRGIATLNDALLGWSA
eukprot:1143617-Pelagomonas_calceolata.AAC.13